MFSVCLVLIIAEVGLGAGNIGYNTLEFRSSTRPTFKQLDQAVQYIYSI